MNDNPTILPDPAPRVPTSSDVRSAVVDVLRGMTMNGKPISVQGSDIVTSGAGVRAPMTPFISITPAPTPQSTPVTSGGTTGFEAPPTQGAESIRTIVQTPQAVQPTPAPLGLLPAERPAESTESAVPTPPAQQNVNIQNVTNGPEVGGNQPTHRDNKFQTMNHAGPVQAIGLVNGMACYLILTAQINGTV